MPDKSYYRKLRSAKWRKKCKEILNRDNYNCTCCGSDKALEVHHTFYFSDFPDPWKYPNASLLTLCHNCHKEYHTYHENIIKSYSIRKDPVTHKPVKLIGKIIKPKKERLLSLSEQQSYRGLRIRKRTA